MLALLLICGATLVLGYVNKARCAGPEFDEVGRTQPNYDIRRDRDVCYSDIQYLWSERDINRHIFPYLSGGIADDGTLVGGTVEYPVLTGMLQWLAALPASNDGQFLLSSAVLLAPFGLLTAYFLGRLARWRALLWALSPPLVLYAFHNWDLPVVACSVAAFWLMQRTRWPLARRGVVAAVLLGVGFALKLYPAIFVLPLAAYVATGGPGGRELPGSKRYDVAGAVRVCAAALGTAVLINLPFAVLGFDGWRASFTFQQLRQVDMTTNSIWFWGFRPFSDDAAFQQVIGWLSPLLVLCSFALALGLAWRRYQREGTFAWIATSGAMLCGFLLLHKVHSPQYVLWLLPFLVLLRVHWGWIAGYLAADLAMGIGIFRWFYAINHSQPATIYDGLAAQAVTVGVWGRAVLLVVLFWVFLQARFVSPPASGETPSSPSDPTGADSIGRPTSPQTNAVERSHPTAGSAHSPAAQHGTA